MLVMHLLEHGQVASSPGEGESFSTCTLAKPSVVESQDTAWLNMGAQTMNFLVALGDNVGRRHQHGPWPYQGNHGHQRLHRSSTSIWLYMPLTSRCPPAQAAKVMTSPRHQSVAQTAFIHMALKHVVAWGSSMDH